MLGFLRLCDCVCSLGVVSETRCFRQPSGKASELNQFHLICMITKNHAISKLVSTCLSALCRRLLAVNAFMFAQGMFNPYSSKEHTVKPRIFST